MLPACPLRALTGLDCPLCGATRATHALLRGDVLTALDFNALYVLALPILALLVVRWFRTGRVAVRSTWAWAAFAVVVGFGVVRNLPPFTVLGA